MTLDWPHALVITALLAGASVLGSQGIFSAGDVFGIFIGVMSYLGISVGLTSAGKLYTLGRRDGSAKHAASGDPEP